MKLAKKMLSVTAPVVRFFPQFSRLTQISNFEFFEKFRKIQKPLTK